jgi:glycosyltransferase involved in cell wall biosynthesis
VEPVHIVQTPARIFPAIGGVERYTLDLSTALVRLGHDVQVICANEPASAIDRRDGVRIKRLHFFGKVANTNITLSLLFHLLRTDFDLIHTHMPTPWTMEMSLLAAKIKRKPCVLTYHNDVEKAGLLGLATRAYSVTVLKLVLSLVDRILVTQPRILTTSKALAPHRSKVRIVPNGIAQMPSKPSLERLPSTLLFVSVLDAHHRYKGFQVLAQAMAHLKQVLPDIRLVVVGRGELVPEYQALVAKLDLERQVQFLGYVDADTLHDLYGRCTMFVLPSIDAHEGFGIVLLEAMAHGAPVITTTAAGLSDEIAERVAGLVVPPKDAPALAQAIRRLLECRHLRNSLGLRGCELVKTKYRWSVIAKDVQTIYQELVL